MKLVQSDTTVLNLSFFFWLSKFFKIVLLDSLIVKPVQELTENA